MSAPTSSVYLASTPPAQAVSGAERATRAPGEDPSIVAAWGEDGFTFGDLLDLINPLQHLPIISTLYRKFTGDEIAPGPRLLGGGLFGGVLGVASAAVGVAVEAATGKDIGEHVLALFDGRPEETGTTAIAWATPRTGAVALAAEEPPAVALLAQAATAPERGARATEPGPSLAPLDSGLVPIEPLLTHLALSSRDADGLDPKAARVGGDTAASDLYRLTGAGASSERLSAIELARILALYHENARRVQETQSAIDSAL